MQFTNQSGGNDFSILGLLNSAEANIPLFVVFLLIFLVTIIGNVIILTVVTMDQSLQIPMYFFLSNLSFLEIWYTMTIVPKLLANLLMKSNNISFSGCMTQLFFFVAFGATECYLLLVMAYDRYMAICKPLYYSSLMNTNFCESRQVNHFFCDIPPLLELSCGDIYLAEISIFILSLTVLFSCLLLTLVSYFYIVISILRMKSNSSRSRTFSTCGSHLTVVLIYYGTMIFMYVRPHSSYSSDMKKFISVFYTVVTPGLNPIIYSLRNKEVKIFQLTLKDLNNSETP
ncbi:hypothetical protein GDO81_027683 [Engystomops pustulosus]|uniref:G-protein coupled receptors family 1 profile domain-containing protein n=1 Tax=Engystomops pustulosus TaxID=76066 RepID=A0AAV6ZFC4_ENGPU|nr:hypothetical protein GDO81_027683 [Engystomops pustulosus]